MRLLNAFVAETWIMKEAVVVYEAAFSYEDVFRWPTFNLRAILSQVGKNWNPLEVNMVALFRFFYRNVEHPALVAAKAFLFLSFVLGASFLSRCWLSIATERKNKRYHDKGVSHISSRKAKDSTRFLEVKGQVKNGR